ncbi:MAG: zinc-ribbon domain-containing protein, partial [Archangium sp.]|nr:zinc-ribbon domain-containing protein [Archangium sp.]
RRVSDERVGEVFEWRRVDASCPDCQTRYEVRYVDVPTTGRIVQCHHCTGIYRVLRLGTLPSNATVSREARCPSCHTPTQLTAAAFASDDELTCAQCRRRYRPSNGEAFIPPAPPRQGVMFFGTPAVEHARAHGEDFTFGVQSSAPPREPPPGGAPTPTGPAQELVRCPACSTVSAIARERLGAGAEVQCTRCNHVFTARPSTQGTQVARAVAGPPPAAQQPPPFRSRADFIGVTAARAARQLLAHGRRLPIDVWLALADRLLATLEPVPIDAPFWSRWTGPEGFGIDLEGQFVAFDDEPATPNFPRDWVHPPMEGYLTDDRLERMRVWAVCRALVWLLDPFPTSRDGNRLERVFEHPQLPPALHSVLDAGLGLAGPPTLPILHRAILESLRPASLERVKAVLFALGFDTPPEDRLPEKWRGGALQVHLDQLLERAEPIEQCPADPRAIVTTPFSMPLTPTRTLELSMLSGAQVIRRVPVTATLGFPTRIALPVGATQRPHERVGLELRHPRQRALTVALEGVVDTEGFVVPTIDARAKAELDVLLASLDDEAAGPAFVPPRRVEPEPRPAQPTSVVPYLVLAGLMGAGLGLVLLLVLLFTLPLVLVCAVLVWRDVISTTTAAWVIGAGTALILVLTVLHLLTSDASERED